MGIGPRREELPGLAVPASLEDLVDSVTVDAMIRGSSGPHFGASPGPLSDAFFHREIIGWGRGGGDRTNTFHILSFSNSLW